MRTREETNIMQEPNSEPVDTSLQGHQTELAASSSNDEVEKNSASISRRGFATNVPIVSVSCENGEVGTSFPATECGEESLEDGEIEDEKCAVIEPEDDGSKDPAAVMELEEAAIEHGNIVKVEPGKEDVGNALTSEYFAEATARTDSLEAEGRSGEEIANNVFYLPNVGSQTGSDAIGNATMLSKQTKGETVVMPLEYNTNAEGASMDRDAAKEPPSGIEVANGGEHGVDLITAMSNSIDTKTEPGCSSDGPDDCASDPSASLKTFADAREQLPENHAADEIDAPLSPEKDEGETAQTGLMSEKKGAPNMNRKKEDQAEQLPGHCDREIAAVEVDLLLAQDEGKEENAQFGMMLEKGDASNMDRKLDDQAEQLPGHCAREIAVVRVDPLAKDAGKEENAQFGMMPEKGDALKMNRKQEDQAGQSPGQCVGGIAVVRVDLLAQDEGKKENAQFGMIPENVDGPNMNRKQEDQAEELPGHCAREIAAVEVDVGRAIPEHCAREIASVEVDVGGAIAAGEVDLLLAQDEGKLENAQTGMMRRKEDAPDVGTLQEVQTEQLSGKYAAEFVADRVDPSFVQDEDQKETAQPELILEQNGAPNMNKLHQEPSESEDVNSDGHPLFVEDRIGVKKNEEEKAPGSPPTDGSDSHSESESDDSDDSLSSSSDSSDDEHPSEGKQSGVLDEDHRAAAQALQAMEEDDLAPAGPIRSQNEQDLNSVPIEHPKVSIAPTQELMQVGPITSIMDKAVIVMSTAAAAFTEGKSLPIRDSSPMDATALDAGTVLVFEDRSVLGAVFETFGQVMAPVYIVRFNNNEEIAAMENATIGSRIFSVPSLCNTVRAGDVRTKGYDSSNRYDEEVVRDEEFSDDEAEARAKRARKRGADPCVGGGKRLRSDGVENGVQWQSTSGQGMSRGGRGGRGRGGRRRVMEGGYRGRGNDRGRMRGQMTRGAVIARGMVDTGQGVARIQVAYGQGVAHGQTEYGQGTAPGGMGRGQQMTHGQATERGNMQIGNVGGNVGWGSGDPGAVMGHYGGGAGGVGPMGGYQGWVGLQGYGMPPQGYVDQQGGQWQRGPMVMPSQGFEAQNMAHAGQQHVYGGGGGHEMYVGQHQMYVGQHQMYGGQPPIFAGHPPGFVEGQRYGGQQSGQVQQAYGGQQASQGQAAFQGQGTYNGGYATGGQAGAEQNERGRNQPQYSYGPQYGGPPAE